MYSLKILQNWTRDFNHSSLLMFDKKLYMFNCSDGTQRNAADQNVKFHKISNIFYNDSHIDAYLGTFGFWMSRTEQITGQLIAHSSNLEKATDKNKKLIEEELNQLKKLKSMKLWGPPGFRKNFKNVDHFFFEGINKYVLEFDKKKNVFNTLTNKEIEYFEDENLKIFPICTSNLNNQRDEKTNTKHANVTNSNNLYFNDIEENFWKKYDEKTNFNYEYEDTVKFNYAMSYICEPHLKPPSFLPDKAKKLGLKPGPEYGELQKGKSVFLSDGTEIKPEDVLGKQAPSSCVGIFYSPSLDHAECLVRNETVKKFQAKSENRIFTVAVHILKEASIFEKEFYQNFMKSFGEDTLHIIDCKETNFKFLLNEGKHKIKSILSKVDSDLFKENLFTYEDTLPSKNLSCLNTFDNLKNFKSSNLISSYPGFEFQLYPIEKIKIIKEKIYEDPFLHKDKNYRKFLDEIEKIIQKLKNEENPIILHNQNNYSNTFNKEILKSQEEIFESIFNKETEPEITFLGTTSMKPGKYRNVSSILVTFSKMYNNNSILLDCGEGTFNQIYEHFGNAKTNELLLKLKLIFITHKHGDHMLGTLKIISEIDKLLTSQEENFTEKENKPNIDSNSFFENNHLVYIIAPSTVKKWLQKSIIRDIKYKNCFNFVDCADLNPNSESVYKEYIEQHDHHPLKNFQDCQIISDKNYITSKINEYHKTNSKNLEIQKFFQFINKHLGINFYTIEVFHCNESYGCFIEESSHFIKNKSEKIKRPWKISYSGDTRPCNNFWNYSYGSTVFIHEATFDDELGKDAMDKMHSTFNEAMCIGLNNESWKIILTHFSPRYIKSTKWNEIFKKHKILLSHDFLSCKLSDLEWAYYYAKWFSKVMDILEQDKKFENLL